MDLLNKDNNKMIDLTTKEVTTEPQIDYNKPAFTVEWHPIQNMFTVVVNNELLFYSWEPLK